MRIACVLGPSIFNFICALPGNTNTGMSSKEKAIKEEKELIAKTRTISVVAENCNTKSNENDTKLSQSVILTDEPSRTDTDSVFETQNDKRNAGNSSESSDVAILVELLPYSDGLAKCLLVSVMVSLLLLQDRFVR